MTSGLRGSGINVRRSNTGVGGIGDAADDESNGSGGANSQGPYNTNGYDVDNDSFGRRKSLSRSSSNLGYVLEDDVLEDENETVNDELDIEPPENADEEWYQSIGMERNRPE